MSNKYEVIVDDDTYELFREAMSRTLTREGFQVRLHVMGMESPSFVEFRKDEDVLTLQATSVSGDNLRVVVQSETLDVEGLVLGVVEEAVLRLVNLLAGSLDESARGRMVRELRDLLRGLPPGKGMGEEGGRLSS